jgi:peptide/nickel transport system ATP-binding protein/oligopeptide transport system ATP-binding protein
MIAMALSCDPDLLIADEPTTALDVTIQAQILDLMNTLQKKTGTAILLITHDLAVVAETCDRVVVMYAGKVAEYTDVYRLFERPAHPYTAALFSSLPDIDGPRGVLPTIPGMVPSAVAFPEGCRFRDRCRFADEDCLEEPAMVEIEHGHFVACHHVDRLRAEREEGTG